MLLSSYVYKNCTDFQQLDNTFLLKSYTTLIVLVIIHYSTIQFHSPIVTCKIHNIYPNVFNQLI